MSKLKRLLGFGGAWLWRVFGWSSAWLEGNASSLPLRLVWLCTMWLTLPPALRIAA
ncbi:hypothetical protein [Cerasicoccus maritimus]|uniref:hypothetical protein n=1 Tax=Cerasicoccus maritimus TaxID=490089 RepID=UPI002852C7FB|nr:hypothetical protein [Cerasicoccus maritimus]